MSYSIIEFFVAAYYFKKKKSFTYVANRIVKKDNGYHVAKEEYMAMRNYFESSDEMVKYIRNNLKGSYLGKFNDTYSLTELEKSEQEQQKT